VRDDDQLRQLCLLVAVGLCVGAFVAIVAVLGSDPALGGYLAWYRTEISLIGGLTTLAAVAAFIAVLARVLSTGVFGDWTTAGCLTMVSIGSAQVSLRLSPRGRTTASRFERCASSP
jgi:uncharacterized membrane protein YidH (DUF202 family)